MMTVTAGPDDDYPELNELVERCIAEGGVTLSNLGELREALGYKRLGKWVLGELADALDATDLGYFPTHVLQPEVNLEPRQWQELWIYRKDDGPVARVLNAVLDAEADPQSVRSTLTAIRLDDAEDLTAEQKLERIKAVVNS